MLVNVISWIILFFVFLTSGDMLLTLYNKVSKRNEEYNLPDKIFLGLAFISIPLAIWSLWLPANHLFLSIFLLVSVCYWAINYKRAYLIFRHINTQLRENFSPLQSILLIAFILSSLFFFSWQHEVYDSAFYHLQNIRWNEEYAVVPGIANIDDRFGFNSNYFLLSAIFSFRFILGEALFPLQPFVVTIVGIWIISELFKSKYEIKRVVILFCYLLFCTISIYFLQNTSTDILPNIIVFYLIARYILYPDLLKKNYLIAIVIPVFLLTCKLSLFPIGVISIYIMYLLIKEKKYNIIAYTCLLSLLILVPWLIRNVIISGYLIYPLNQIDLFSFDWKVPQEIAIRQKEYIFNIGYYFLRTALRYPHLSVRDPLWINILTDIIYLLVALSMAFTAYRIMKKRKDIYPHTILLFAVFFLSLIVWIAGGPDIRFIPGIMCTIIMMGGILFFEEKRHIPKLGISLLLILFIGMGLWTGKQINDFYTQIKNKNIHPVSHMLIKPYSMKNQVAAKDIDVTNQFEATPINNDQIIWVGSEFPYDVFLPSYIYGHYSIFLPIECIEARGHKIQDGYKPKKGC